MSRFILSAFADEIHDDLDLQMDTLAEHGVSHIEFRAGDGRGIADYTQEEAKSAIKRIKARGMALSAIGSPIGKFPIEEDFAPHYEKFLHVIKLAQIMEAPNIRMFSFFYPKGSDPKEYRSEVMRRLEQMVKAVKGTGVTLLHENEWGIYGDLPERCRDIYDTVGGEELKLIFDPGNFVACNARVFPDAFKLLRDAVVYFHVKDKCYDQKERNQVDMGFKVVSDLHRPVGQGDGNWPQIIEALQQEGFEGFCSIEPHLTHYDGVPGTGAEKFGVAVEAFKDLVKSTGGTLT